MTDKEKIRAYVKRLQKPEGHGDYWKGYDSALNDILSFIDSMQEEPTTSVWHDAKDTPVASKTKIVLYTNGKWDMFKAYETKDDYDNYWAGVNQALKKRGVLVKRWAYVEDLLKL